MGPPSYPARMLAISDAYAVFADHGASEGLAKGLEGEVGLTRDRLPQHAALEVAKAS